MEDLRPEQTDFTLAERGLVDDLNNPISLSELLTPMPTPPIMSDDRNEQSTEKQTPTTTD